MKYIASFFRTLTSFRLLSMGGLIMGALIYRIATEQQPLSMYLLGYNIYLIALLIVLGIHIFIWLVIDHGSLYDIKELLGSTVLDFILFVIMMWAMIGTLFLINVFIVPLL